MLVEAEFLNNQVLQTSVDGFMRDEVRKRPFVRSLEVIGEAAKKVPQDVRDLFPDVQWTG